MILNRSLWAVMVISMLSDGVGCNRIPSQSSSTAMNPFANPRLSVVACPEAAGVRLSVKITNRANRAIWAAVGPLHPRIDDKLPLLYYGGSGNICIFQATTRVPANYEQGAPNTGILLHRIEPHETLSYNLFIPAETEEQVAYEPVFDLQNHEAQNLPDQNRAARLQYNCRKLLFVQGFFNSSDIPRNLIHENEAAPTSSLVLSIPGPNEMMNAGLVDYASLPNQSEALGRARTLVNASYGSDGVDVVELQKIEAVSVELHQTVKVYRRP